MTRHRSGDRTVTAPGNVQPADAEEVALPHDVAVELLNAAIHDFASHQGVRVLTIKGRALADQGLRQVRGSSDADVLVDPAEFERLWGLLQTHGWTDRDKAFLVDLPPAGSVLAPHARTLEHPEWPCHLDLHRYYPGLLKPAAEVFDTLWAARSETVMAHRACPVPNPCDHWLIAALHAERSRDAAQLEDLEERALARLQDDFTNLDERARLTGASGPLSGPLGRLLGTTPALTSKEEELTRLWRRRVASEHTLPEALVEQFRVTDWKGRLRLALRQLVPSSRFAQAFHGAKTHPASLARFYLLRLISAPRHAARVVVAALRTDR